MPPAKLQNQGNGAAGAEAKSCKDKRVSQSVKERMLSCKVLNITVWGMHLDCHNGRAHLESCLKDSAVCASTQLLAASQKAPQPREGVAKVLPKTGACHCLSITVKARHSQMLPHSGRFSGSGIGPHKLLCLCVVMFPQSFTRSPDYGPGRACETL